MTMLTKFPGVKMSAVGASVLATVAIWVALAWPEWNAGAASQNASAPAGVAATESVLETVAQPNPPAPVIVRRVYIVKRASAGAPPRSGTAAVEAPPPRFAQDQPSSPAPHPMPIARSRGS